MTELAKQHELEAAYAVPWHCSRLWMHGAQLEDWLSAYEIAGGYPRVYCGTGRDMQARHAGMGYHRTGMGMSRLDALLDLLVGPIPSRWCRVFPVDGAVSAQPFACLRAGNTQLGSAAADQNTTVSVSASTAVLPPGCCAGVIHHSGARPSSRNV